MGKKVIHCIGDSHVLVFKYIQNKGLLPQLTLKTTHVNGATAQGMVNPNSKTNALNRFEEITKKAKTDEWLLFMLGEVDCGFVIWYRAEKHGIPVQEQLDISLGNYFNFVNKKANEGFRDIILCTAHLPTIKDDQDFGEIANLRKEVKATQRQRTDLTIAYNERIRAFCRKNGFHVLDIEQETLDPETKMINPYYMNKNPKDHHLEKEKIAPLYVAQLKKLFKWHLRKQKFMRKLTLNS